MCRGETTQIYDSDQNVSEWTLTAQDAAEPTHYWLSNLPADIRWQPMIDTTMGRWRIERDYEELKQELGLGHFEGRNWRGFHHHASLCIAAYGFLIQERLSHGKKLRSIQSTSHTRRLPPSRGWVRCSAINRVRSRPADSGSRAQSLRHSINVLVVGSARREGIINTVVLMVWSAQYETNHRTLPVLKTPLKVFSNAGLFRASSHNLRIDTLR